MKRKGTNSVNLPKHQELTGQVQHRGAPTSWELKHTGQKTLLQSMASSRRAKLKVRDARLQRGPDLNRRRSQRHSFTRSV